MSRGDGAMPVHFGQAHTWVTMYKVQCGKMSLFRPDTAPRSPSGLGGPGPWGSFHPGATSVQSDAEYSGDGDDVPVGLEVS